MGRQMTLFDILSAERAPDWEFMPLKDIAAYIGQQTGLRFIPDTRYHGDYDEFIAYHTSTLFFTLGLSTYKTLDERDGKPFISAGWEDKKEHSGSGRPCDSLEEAAAYFKAKLEV